jgi:flagellar motility protein MotE (MotC chaperone)
MYAQMAPEEAAPRMEKMDRSLALKILAQLKPKTAAQILSGMSPETAAKFSERLARPAK